MSYVSIALLRWTEKKDGSKDHVNENAQFLVIKDENWQFLEFHQIALGASFKRDWFEKQLTKHFESEFQEADFTFVEDKKDEGKDNPASTTYVIEVTPEILNVINDKIDQEPDKYFWKNFIEIEKLKTDWKPTQKFLIENAIKGKALPIPPEFDNDFLTTIEHIQDAKDKGNLVIFVGAGISKNSGVPLWSELIEELKKLIPQDENETDQLIIPQLFHNEVGDTQYQKTIQKILRHKRVKFDKVLHKSILNLKPTHIITTNYDNLIEQSIDHDTESLNYSLICEDKDLPFADSPNFLVKMHGDFEKKNIVLKEDDYHQYSFNFPLIENFIKGVFSSKLVLFIGFSYTDNNLKYIIERVRNVLQKNYQPAFLFDTSDSSRVSKQKREYFKNKGVHIINYDEKIKEYLKGKKLNETIDFKDNDRGQKTFNFLHFINNYNRFTERSKNLHIIDQMYNALMKFEELSSIPPNFIAKIQPFALGEKDSEQAEYSSFGFHLKTKNETIIKLLKKVEIIEGEIAFKDSRFENEISKKVWSAKDKLKFVFQKLGASGIICIQRKDDNLSGNHHRIDLNTKEDCNCSNCRFKRLEIHELLENLNTQTFPEIINDECRSSFREAYIHFFCGNILTAFRILNKVCLDSYKEKKFITYFLAKHSISQILWRVKGLYVPSQISREEKEFIEKEIRVNNIPALIESLPVDTFTKKIFHSINNEEQIEKTKKEMEKDLASIKRVFEIYQNNGSEYLGANHYSNLYCNFAALHTFLYNNFFYEVIYGTFRGMALKLWEGALISFETADSYQYKLKEFSSYLFEVAIFNISADDFSPLLSKHNKSNLLVAPQEAILDLIEKGINLFSSNYKINNFFTTSIDAKGPFLIQKEKSIWFKQRMKNYGGNIMLLLARLNLDNVDSAKLNSLIEHTFNYLVVEGRGFTLREKYFAIFYKSVIKYFDDKKINQLIDLIISDDLYSKEFIEPICKSIVENHPDYKIQNKSTLEKILNRITTRHKMQIDIKDILPFYAILDDNLKLQFQQKVIDVIYRFEDKNIENIDWKLYLTSVLRGIIDFNEDKLFDKYLKNQLPKITPLDYHKSEDEFYFSSEYVAYFLKIYYENKIQLTTQQKKVVIKKDVDDFIKWVLLPNEFDFGKFDIRWLILVGHVDEIIQGIASQKISKLKKAAQNSLKKNHHPKLSEIYWKYF